MLRVAPRQREEQKKHHGTLRDTIAASSRLLSLSPKGDTRWVESVGFIFRAGITNTRHHHQACPLYVIWPIYVPETIKEALLGPDKP